MALNKFTYGKWVPTGEVRFWRDLSANMRDWELQYEFHRSVFEYTPMWLLIQDRVETEWRRIPFVQMNEDRPGGPSW